jgi:hypothetical protein
VLRKVEPLRVVVGPTLGHGCGKSRHVLPLAATRPRRVGRYIVGSWRSSTSNADLEQHEELQQVKVCNAEHDPEETASCVVLGWQQGLQSTTPAGFPLSMLAVGPVKRRG